MEFNDLIVKRRSVRKFSNQDVNLDDVKQILDESLQAPSSCNHQLYRFLVIDDDSLKKQLVKKCGANRILADAPVCVILLTQMGWNHSKKSYVQSIGAIGYNVLLSATNRGLASVWMAGIGNTDKIRTIFNIPTEYEVLSIIAIGYEDDENESYPKPDRYNVSQKYSLNRFDVDADLIFPIEVKRKKISHCWDPSKWTIKQIDNWRGHAIYACAASKMAYVGRNSIYNFNYEVNYFSENINGSKILFLMAFSGKYPAGLIEKMKGRGVQIYIHEVSDKYINFIKARLTQISHLVDVTYISNDDFIFADKFDTIIMPGCLEHLPSKNRISLLNNIQKYLNANGVLLISYFNKYSWYYLFYLKYLKSRQVPNKGPFIPISGNEIMASVRGLKLECVKGISILPFKRFLGKEVKNILLKKLAQTVLLKYIKHD